MAKNITLAIDEDLLDRVRVIAALRRTSVNEMVRGYLTHVVLSETQQDEITQGLLALTREQSGDIGPDHDAPLSSAA